MNRSLWRKAVALTLTAAMTAGLTACGGGGNSRLAVATLDDGDLIVWTGHLVFLLSDFRYKKSRRHFSDFLLGVPLGAAGI